MPFQEPKVRPKQNYQRWANMGPAIEEIVEKHVREWEKKRKEKIVTNFVTLDSPPLAYVADDIEPGQFVDCKAGAAETPGDFYVSPESNRTRLEMFMNNMQPFYDGIMVGEKEVLCDIAKLAILTDKELKDGLEEGLYVVVKSEIGCEEESKGQWHRAKILRRVGDLTYEVRFIDYGDNPIIKASVKKIRYLHLNFYKRMKAQAIPCIAKLGSYYNTVMENGWGWSKQEGEKFRQMIMDRNLIIHFKEKIIRQDGTTAWRVFAHRASRRQGFRGHREIEVHHVERAALIICRGKYMHIPKEKEESDYKDKHYPLTILPGRNN